jgi:hypothetical protein
MKTDYFEILLPEKSDPFSAMIRLKKQGKVLRANMVKMGVMGIVYYSDRITEAEIKEAIGLKESNGEKLKLMINAQ